MSLLTILIALVIVGVLLWFVNSYIPVEENIKKIFNILVVTIIIVWLMNAFGVIGYLSNIHTGSIQFIR